MQRRQKSASPTQVQVAPRHRLDLTPSLLRHARSALHDLTGELTRAYFEQVEMASENGFRTLLLGELAEIQYGSGDDQPPPAIISPQRFPGTVNEGDPNQFFDAIYVFGGTAVTAPGQACPSAVREALERHQLWHYHWVTLPGDAGAAEEEWRRYRRMWTAIPGHYDDGGICQLADWLRVKQVWRILKQARLARHQRVLLIDADRWLKQQAAASDSLLSQTVPAPAAKLGRFAEALRELPEKWQMWYLGGVTDPPANAGIFYANGTVRQGPAVALQEPVFAALQEALMTLAAPWEEIFRQEQRRLGEQAIASYPALL